MWIFCTLYYAETAIDCEEKIGIFPNKKSWFRCTIKTWVLYANVKSVSINMAHLTIPYINIYVYLYTNIDDSMDCLHDSWSHGYASLRMRHKYSRNMKKREKNKNKIKENEINKQKQTNKIRIAHIWMPNSTTNLIPCDRNINKHAQTHAVGEAPAIKPAAVVCAFECDWLRNAMCFLAVWIKSNVSANKNWKLSSMPKA